jgi:hypothetical protein
VPTIHSKSWKTALLLSAAPLLGCARLVPVPHAPWVEERTLELRREVLRLSVQPDVVDVDATFHFRSRGRALARILTFPIGGPGGATAFAATLGEPERSERLPTRRAGPGDLPAGPARETYEIYLRESPSPRVRVRYRQQTRHRFAYVLRTGAYWAGPIGDLRVEVVDPGLRVATALVEGRPPGHGESGLLAWNFRNIEPSSGVELELR